MENRNSELEDLYQEMSARFGALGHLFGQLSSPEAVRELLDSLISGDAADFNRLVDSVDIPMIGKCFWIWGLIERAFLIPLGFVEECWLRDNLTADERRLYFLITRRHHHPTLVDKPILMLSAGYSVIPPGAFLDELKANGLVECKLTMTYDTSLNPSVLKPELVCI